MQEEIQRFVEQVRDVYRDLVTNRIVRGRALFAQFEAAAVAGCREGSERNLTERVNELAVAKLLAICAGESIILQMFTSLLSKSGWVRRSTEMPLPHVPTF